MMHISFKPICMCSLCFFTIVKLSSSGEPVQLDKYRTFDEVNDFINGILTKEKTSEIIIGRSYEGRDIRGIKISGSNDSESNIAVLIDGGIHAREWVSTASVIYTIDQLLNNVTNADLVASIDWYILPMLNPDGYNYSMEPLGERLWRKNRAINFNSECLGVDLNRNFGFAWGGPGSSDNPCDWNYRGLSPFSEPETRALANFIMTHVPQIKMYLTLHSSAQAIIYPWGFTDQRPADWKQLESLAKLAAKEMSKIKQTQYEVGMTTDTVGIGAGGSDDWAKGVAGINYVYTMELPGPGYNLSGFAPSEAELGSIMLETFKGIKVFATELKLLYSLQ